MPSHRYSTASDPQPTCSMRRKRKCILMGVVMVISAVMFLLLSSRGRPKPHVSGFRLAWVPSRTTYVTQGAPSSGELSHLEFQVVPKALVDERTASYFTKDIAAIERVLTKLSDILTLEWRFLKSFDVDDSELQKAWPKDTVKLINHIKHVRKGMDASSSKVKSIDDMLDQVHILKTRAFPMGERKRCRNCFPYTLTSYIHPWSVCAKTPNIDLLMLVTSKPQNTEARRVIRTTWGSYAKNNTNKVKLVFLFGKIRQNPSVDEILREESLKHHDILQDNYQEGYYSLAYKVIGGLKWAMHSCSQAKFIMVAADDIFVSIPAILKTIEKYGRSDGFSRHIVGNCRTREKPYRWPDYKDYISTLEFDKDTYPPYPTGSLFLASNQLTKEILKMSVNVAYFPRGDVYIGLVMEQLGRGCHDVEGLLLPFSTRIPTQPFFGLHPLTPVSLEEKYRRLLMHSLSSLYRPE